MREGFQSCLCVCLFKGEGDSEVNLPVSIYGDPTAWKALFLPSLEGPIHTKKDRTQKINKAAKVLATRLSNQCRRIRTWHYGVVFVQQKRSLFYQEDQLISRISYSKDKKPQQKQETINHV